MQICFVDEANLSFNKNLEFFIFGGIVVDEKEIGSLARDVFQIKKYFGIPDSRPVKWPNVSWKGASALEPSLHAKIKNEFLNLINDSDLKIIICLSPHLFSHKYKTVGTEIKFVIDSTKQTRSQIFALELCLQKFHLLLEEEEDFGMVIADDFGNLHTQMKDHCLALFPKGTTFSSLERIVYPVVQLENEYSPLTQLNDVVLGAIGYSFDAINFLPRLKNNFWNKDKVILNRGITIYPMHPKSPSLAEDIYQLRSKFNLLLNA